MGKRPLGLESRVLAGMRAGGLRCPLVSLESDRGLFVYEHPDRHALVSARGLWPTGPGVRRAIRPASPRRRERPTPSPRPNYRHIRGYERMKARARERP